MSEAKHHVPVGYLFIDLETTGLDPKEDLVLEAAWAYVPASSMWKDSVEGFVERIRTAVFAVPANRKVFDAFVARMHARSGLLEALKEPSIFLVEAGGTNHSLDTALYGTDEEASAVWRIRPKEERVSLAGSSVHFDLGFLRVHAPGVASRLSHRVLDVSAITLMCRSLGMPTSEHKGEPISRHRAVDDLLASYRIGLECLNWLERRPSTKT